METPVKIISAPKQEMNGKNGFLYEINGSQMIKVPDAFFLYNQTDAEESWSDYIVRADQVKYEITEGSRAYTEEEIREALLKKIWMYIDYWYKESRVSDTREKLEGLAFSLLAMLDGSNADIPGFKIIPSPHKDDKKYHIHLGENYYPDNVDIGGFLHELFHSNRPEAPTYIGADAKFRSKSSECECRESPDTCHHWYKTDCVQSVDTIICKYCGKVIYD
jgi:hypothetical protein